MATQSAQHTVAQFMDRVSDSDRNHVLADVFATAPQADLELMYEHLGDYLQASYKHDKALCAELFMARYAGQVVAMIEDWAAFREFVERRDRRGDDLHQIQRDANDSLDLVGARRA